MGNLEMTNQELYQKVAVEVENCGRLAGCFYCGPSGNNHFDFTGWCGLNEAVKIVEKMAPEFYEAFLELLMLGAQVDVGRKSGRMYCYGCVSDRDLREALARVMEVEHPVDRGGYRWCNFTDDRMKEFIKEKK